MTGCLICPIYDKGRDFEFGYEFVKSAVEFHLEDSLYFVFSAQMQREKFLSECQRRFGREPHGLVFDRNLSDCQNPVTIKKFYALWKLSEDFDYLAAIDCECLCTRSFNVGEVFDEIWKTGSCFASNMSLVGSDDILKCAMALGVEYDSDIIRETDQYNYTWWFNDIPVYRGKDIAPFFQWIEQNNYWKIIYHNWHCFDYLVYGLWNICEKGMRIKRCNLKNVIGIIESLWKPEVRNKVRIEKEIGTHWTSRIDSYHPENRNICLQFHCDRRSLRLKQCLGRYYFIVKYRLKYKRFGKRIFS